MTHIDGEHIVMTSCLPCFPDVYCGAVLRLFFQGTDRNLHEEFHHPAWETLRSLQHIHWTHRWRIWDGYHLLFGSLHPFDSIILWFHPSFSVGRFASLNVQMFLSDHLLFSSLFFGHRQLVVSFCGQPLWGQNAPAQTHCRWLLHHGSRCLSHWHDPLLHGTVCSTNGLFCFKHWGASKSSCVSHSCTDMVSTATSTTQSLRFSTMAARSLFPVRILWEQRTGRKSR